MNPEIYIDIGSRTTKAFLASNEKLTNLKEKTIDFAEDYKQDNRISDDARRLLFDFIREIQKENPEFSIKAFATAFFRKLPLVQEQVFVSDFASGTGIDMQIISQDLESEYLVKALLHKCPPNSNVLIINIGGESTELAIVNDKKVSQRINIDFGINKIKDNFPLINNIFSPYSLESVTGFVKNQLPSVETQLLFGFNTGNELLYSKLLNYPLEANTFFKDEEHPFMIKIQDYFFKNKEIFQSVSIGGLELLMPQNPQRMLAARPAVAIAQGICEKYGVESIVPSDADWMHGILEDRKSSSRQ